MKWGTAKEMLESAKKFAAIEDDLAVKAEEYNDYQWHKGIANLLRAMSEEVKRLDGVAEASWGIVYGAKRPK